MIDDENNPEWQAVELEIGKQCLGVFLDHGFTQTAQRIAQELCDDATRQARRRGLDFPDMVVVCYKQSRQVRIYRRDADHAMKQRYIVRISRACPEMKAAEIAEAFREAWPDYRPEVEDKLATMQPQLKSRDLYSYLPIALAPKIR
jgi:hypothetical protein